MSAKKLLVMRHAHSLMSDSGDHARQLSEVGRQQAKQIAAYCAQKNLIPSIILCSDAIRTKQTTEILIAKWGMDIPCQYLTSFYNSGIDSVFNEFHRLDNEDTALIVGHNPTWSEILNVLANNFLSMEPAQMAVLTCQRPTWSVEPYSYEFQEILSP